MQESLILLAAIAVLAVPAVAIAALVVALKASHRCEALNRRVESLARELRWHRAQRGDETSVAGSNAGEEAAGTPPPSPETAGSKARAEKRSYSFSFLEEKPGWDSGESGRGAGEEPPETTGEVRPEARPKKKTAAKKKRRGGRRGRK